MAQLQELQFDLLSAITCRDPAEVKRCLENGADANFRYNRDNVIQYPLHYAAMAGELEIIKLLLTAGGALNVQNGTGRTPYFLALINGHIAVTDFFKEQAAEFSTERRETLLLTALFYQQENMALHLLEQNTDPFETNADKTTPLHHAASYGLHRAAKKLLSLGVPIDARDQYNSTPLICAVAQKLPNMALLLLDHGANPNATNSIGNSALSLAIVNKGFISVVRRLIECGAENNLDKTRQGRQALSAMPHLPDYLTLFHMLNDAPKIREEYLAKIAAQKEAYYASFREPISRPVKIRKPLTFHRP